MNRKQIIFLLFIALAVVLSACSGAANTGTSWPGLSVDEQYAYLAYNTQVYAIDLSNGLERWRYPAEANNNITFYADPSLTEDGQLIVGSYDFNLYSLDAESGSQKWVFSEATNRYIASALVDDGMIFAPAADENLYALNQEGRLQWTFTTEGESWAKPVTDDGCDCLFLPSMDHSVYAIDPGDGTEKWRSEKLGGAIVGTPAFNENGELYVGTFGGNLYALNAENGAVDWEFSTADGGWIWSGPVVSEGVLYFGDLNGYFYAVAEESGASLWQKTPDELGGNIVSSPLVIGENIYVTTEDGNLFKLNSTGEILFRQTLDGKIYTTPVAVGDLILIALIESDNLLVAVNENGAQQWAFQPAE